MSEYFVPIFEFEGDAFNGSLVAAIERPIDSDTVRVYLHDRDEPFEYEFDDEDDAVEKCDEAVRAWKKAVGAQ